MKTETPSGRPVAAALFRFYGSRSAEELALVESALVCLFSESSGEPLPILDIHRISEVWNRVNVSPLYLDTETGSALLTLPGDEDTFPDLRFLVLDEPTQRRAIFGEKVSTLLAR